MKSLNRFSFPLLGGLVAFPMVAGISSAATVTVAGLAKQQTFSTMEGNFDHNLPNPLVITISGETWAAGSQGDVRLNETGNTSLSDLVRFVNVGGVATIYFASSDFNNLVPLTGPLSGASPGFTRTGTETVPAMPEPVFKTTSGATVTAIITSDIAGTIGPVGSVSDHIQLQATPGVVPEPSTFTLAGLGALGLLNQVLPPPSHVSINEKLRDSFLFR